MEKELMVNSNLIKKLRKNLGWSQEQLATASGLSLRTIQRVEAEGKASLETKVCLAATLEVKLEEIESQPAERNDTVALPKAKFSSGFIVLVAVAILLTTVGYFLDLPRLVTFVSNLTALFGLIFVAFTFYFSGQKEQLSRLKSAIAGGFICASLFALFGLLGNFNSESIFPILFSVMLFFTVTLIISIKSKFKP